MIEILLPWPNRKTSPNARVHWAQLAQARAGEHFTARLATVAALGEARPAPSDYELTLTFCPPSKRNYDLDNALASCKALLDGVAEGLGIDDSRFTVITLRRGAVVKSGAVKVRLEITPPGAGEE